MSQNDVEAAVSARTTRDPRDVSAALDSQLLAYLREQPVPNASALAPLPTEDREVISAVVDALVNFRATVRADPNSMYSTKVKPLSDLSDRLRVRAELAVPVMSFCSKVNGFGLYEPMPAMLSSRAETRTLLYYEVAHFTSRFAESRLWETRLSQSLTLYDAAGKSVWQDRTQQLTDQCRNRRNDFFVSSPLRLPPQAPGKYTLKVTVTDLNVGRVTESVLPVECK